MSPRSLLCSTLTVVLTTATLRAQSTTDKLRAAADSAIVHNDWKTLVRLYEPVTRAEPTNGMAWFRLGAGLQELGRFTEAAAAFLEAIRVQFQVGQAELRLARVL